MYHMANFILEILVIAQLFHVSSMITYLVSNKSTINYCTQWERYLRPLNAPEMLKIVVVYQDLKNVCNLKRSCCWLF